MNEILNMCKIQNTILSNRKPVEVEADTLNKDGRLMVLPISDK